MKICSRPDCWKKNSLLAGAQATGDTSRMFQRCTVPQSSPSPSFLLPGGDGGSIGGPFFQNKAWKYPSVSFLKCTGVSVQRSVTYPWKLKTTASVPNLVQVEKLSLYGESKSRTSAVRHGLYCNPTFQCGDFSTHKNKECR